MADVKNIKQTVLKDSEGNTVFPVTSYDNILGDLKLPGLEGATWGDMVIIDSNGGITYQTQPSIPQITPNYSSTGTPLTSLKLDGTNYTIAQGTTVTANPVSAATSTLTKLKVGTTTYSVGGTDVEANPTATATTPLNKLRVGETVYSVEGGGSGTELPEYTDADIGKVLKLEGGSPTTNGIHIGDTVNKVLVNLDYLFKAVTYEMIETDYNLSTGTLWVYDANDATKFLLTITHDYGQGSKLAIELGGFGKKYIFNVLDEALASDYAYIPPHSVLEVNDSGAEPLTSGILEIEVSPSFTIGDITSTGSDLSKLMVDHALAINEFATLGGDLAMAWGSALPEYTSDKPCNLVAKKVSGEETICAISSNYTATKKIVIDLDNLASRMAELATSPQDVSELIGNLPYTGIILFKGGEYDEIASTTYTAYDPAGGDNIQTLGWTIPNGGTIYINLSNTDITTVYGVYIPAYGIYNSLTGQTYTSGVQTIYESDTEFKVTLYLNDEPTDLSAILYESPIIGMTKPEMTTEISWEEQSGQSALPSTDNVTKSSILVVEVGGKVARHAVKLDSNEGFSKISIDLDYLNEHIKDVSTDPHELADLIGRAYTSGEFDSSGYFNVSEATAHDPNGGNDLCVLNIYTDQTNCYINLFDMDITTIYGVFVPAHSMYIEDTDETFTEGVQTIFSVDGEEHLSFDGYDRSNPLAELLFGDPVIGLGDITYESTTAPAWKDFDALVNYEKAEDGKVLTAKGIYGPVSTILTDFEPYKYYTSVVVDLDYIFNNLAATELDDFFNTTLIEGRGDEGYYGFRIYLEYASTQNNDHHKILAINNLYNNDTLIINHTNDTVTGYGYYSIPPKTAFLGRNGGGGYDPSTAKTYTSGRIVFKFTIDDEPDFYIEAIDLNVKGSSHAEDVLFKHAIGINKLEDEHVSIELKWAHGIPSDGQNGQVLTYINEIALDGQPLTDQMQVSEIYLNTKEALKANFTEIYSGARFGVYSYYYCEEVYNHSGVGFIGVESDNTFDNGFYINTTETEQVFNDFTMPPKSVFTVIEDSQYNREYTDVTGLDIASVPVTTYQGGVPGAVYRIVDGSVWEQLVGIVSFNKSFTQINEPKWAEPTTPSAALYEHRIQYLVDTTYVIFSIYNAIATKLGVDGIYANLTEHTLCNGTFRVNDAQCHILTIVRGESATKWNVRYIAASGIATGQIEVNSLNVEEDVIKKTIVYNI